jgi:hypothetical protein
MFSLPSSHRVAEALINVFTQTLPSLGPDLWPSISGVVAHPLKTLRRYRLSRSRISDGAPLRQEDVSLQFRPETSVFPQRRFFNSAKLTLHSHLDIYLFQSA